MKTLGWGRLAAVLLLATVGALPSTSAAAVPDFNADGRGDILWRHGTGSVFVWLMNGTGVSSSALVANVSNAWTVQGFGDFNADGKTDLLWRHTSGAVSIWLMNGASVSSTGSPGNVGTDWEIQATGDFNGDGKTDILWRHESGTISIWLIDGTGVIGTGSPGTIDSNWTIQGTGKFNADATTDILWRHSSGTLFIWLMNGVAVASSGSPGGATSDWTVQAVADFNGNGRADILWRHSSGQVFIWFINGTSFVSGSAVGTVDASWTIQGAIDFNFDGMADILWRHSSGTVSIWLMSGAAVTTSGSPGGVGTDWQIVLARCPIPLGCGMLAEHAAQRAGGPFGSGNPVPNPPLAPLTWSVGSAAIAQAWVAGCSFSHNPNLDFYNLGENIAVTGYPAGPQPAQPPASTFFDIWANEVASYTYGPFDMADFSCCGHYTQIVWRRTTSVGCAIQYCTTNSPFGPSFPNWYLVACDYWPPGNFTGEVPY
jgi:hypothetical protein